MIREPASGEKPGNSFRRLISHSALLFPLCAALLAPSADAGESEVELLRREVDHLRARLEELEARLRKVDDSRNEDREASAGTVDRTAVSTRQQPGADDPTGLHKPVQITEDLADEYDREKRQRDRQLEVAEAADAAAGYQEPDDGKPELEVDLGGAVWINYAHQDWVGDDDGRKDNFRFDNLRLSVDSSYGDLLMSAQYRFYSYTQTLHHAWIGYQFSEENRVELGITQVPFGILPYASHNFWFLIPYYVGLEDDYDAGVKWHYEFADNWTLDTAFFLNEEYGDPTDLDRYSTDVVRDGDQQNDERNQFNLRLAYDWKLTEHSRTELGISGRYGSLDNRTTSKTGDYWAAALHANAFLGPWNLMLEGIRYTYSPENPAGVSDDLVLMGNLGSKRLVASKADILVANIAYDFGALWGPIETLTCYNDYSYMRKDESSFNNSQINDTGCVVSMGPFWIWADFILGKNAWYLNDSETDSGFGPGGTNEWEKRLNLSFEWYF